jgi:hypothetical protein
MKSIYATLVLLGVNLVIASVFGLLAARSSPGHAEREAQRVRRQALDAALGSSGWSPRIVAFSPQARAQEIVSPGTRRGSEPPVQPKFEASRSLVAVRQSKTLIAMVATRTCADLLAQ